MRDQTDLDAIRRAVLGGETTAADVVGETLARIEATDEALGNARIAAQQGVEVVEDGFEWIQGLASSLAPSART